MTGKVEDAEGCAAEAACGGDDDDSAEHHADAIIEEPATEPCAHASESSPTEEPLWVAGDGESKMVSGLVEEKVTSRVAGGDDTAGRCYWRRSRGISIAYVRKVQT